MSQLLKDIQQDARNFIESFQPHFDQLECRLDYSIESLEDVDEMLGAFAKMNLEGQELADFSSLVGCYIFEVARRCYGGEYYWIKDERQPMLVAGQPDFFVAIKVWEKVRGRLTKGEEDDIPFYVSGYKEHIAIGKTKPGYHVTIV